MKKAPPEEAMDLIRQSKNAYQVALALGVSWTTASRWREELGIPQPQRRSLYNPENSPLAKDLGYIPLLGTLPDRAIAKKFGVSYELVRRQRQAAGKPPYRRVAPSEKSD